MMRFFLIFILLLLAFSCAIKPKINLKYLDEYVVKDSVLFKNTILGGFSGIDFSNDIFYLVVDDAELPRYVKSDIVIHNKKIKSIDFTDVVIFNDTLNSFYKDNILDLESIFIDKNQEEINFVSEGNIHKNKPPSIFVTDFKGDFKYKYTLPKSFINLTNIKHNAVFEASTKSADKNGFWVAMEGVLTSDGEEANFQEKSTPIRITYFDKKTKKATKQYAYQVEHIIKPAKGNINLNGVTAILEYQQNHFFIVERIYQNGYGAYGNNIKIFEAFANEKSTDILDLDRLKNNPFLPLQKRLIFDFNTVKNKLTEGIIDNIEGITLGPKLANGNQSLILVSDDNFQIYGKQLNQFILLEIDVK